MVRSAAVASIVFVLSVMGTVSQAQIRMPKVSRPSVSAPRVPRPATPRMPSVNIKSPSVNGKRSLGAYQQRSLANGVGTAAGVGVTAATAPALGPYGAKAAGAGAGYAVGHHAEKKWTGSGLKNWNRPNHW